MYRFKTSLVAFLSMAGVVGLAALVTPQTTRGTVGINDKAVFVTNGASDPVPTSVQGTTQIAGDVGITGTPSVGLAPGATVGIDQASNAVQVANSASNPVPVVNVASGAGEPLLLTVSLDLGDGRTLPVYAVPEGKRLFIESVSVKLARGGPIDGALLTTFAGQQVKHHLVFTKQLEAGSDGTSVAARDIRAVVDAASVVQFSGEFSGFVGSGAIIPLEVTLVGRLSDAGAPLPS